MYTSYSTAFSALRRSFNSYPVHFPFPVLSKIARIVSLLLTNHKWQVIGACFNGNLLYLRVSCCVQSVYRSVPCHVSSNQILPRS